MLKTLKSVQKQDKGILQIPKKVQDIIPVDVIYEDGIFQHGSGKFSKSFKFTDVNFVVLSDAEKQGMLLQYAELLNSLDSGVTTKITINNRRLNKSDYTETILMKAKKDGRNGLRAEYNRMLMDKGSGDSSIIQDKYLTVSIYKKSIEEARTTFNRMSADIVSNLKRLGAKCREVSMNERLRIAHDFYRAGEEDMFHFDVRDRMQKGHGFKEYICPDTFENERDYFVMGDRYGRVLYLKDYANFIKDKTIPDLSSLSMNMMISIDIVPVPTDEALRMAEKKLLGADTNITTWQRKQNQNNNFSAAIPYALEQQRLESREFLNDLSTRDQRMMYAIVTIVHTADSLEELNSDTEEIKVTAMQVMSQVATLKFQQLDGLNTVLPFGMRCIDNFRTFTTESLSALMPFNVQEIREEGGIYYGQNSKSKNMIIADRRKLLNGNSFILGVSGSGKSFAGKNEIVNLMLSTDADILVVDPEREYAPLVNALGGTVIEISASSPNHINAMDMGRDYGEVDPIIEKSQFLQSLCEQVIAGHHFAKGQQSIIDRCTENVYRYYRQGNYMGTPPTLQDFRDELLRQPEPEAHSLALELELFTRGTLNTFAKQTNVNTNNRLVCYDILELGEQLRAIGMLVILDNIINRITANRAKGKHTFIFIDEIYLLFMHEYSAQFLFKLWKRVRKYGAYCTGLTQNIEDLLQSHTARTMLANSEFLIMLNQAPSDREELGKLLNISDDLLGYITNVDAGRGLIKVGSSIVPFENDFPKDTKLYRLMTTKLTELTGNDGVRRG